MCGGNRNGEEKCEEAMNVTLYATMSGIGVSACRDDVGGWDNSGRFEVVTEFVNRHFRPFGRGPEKYHIFVTQTRPAMTPYDRKGRI